MRWWFAYAATALIGGSAMALADELSPIECLDLGSDRNRAEIGSLIGSEEAASFLDNTILSPGLLVSKVCVTLQQNHIDALYPCATGQKPSGSCKAPDERTLKRYCDCSALLRQTEKTRSQIVVPVEGEIWAWSIPLLQTSLRDSSEKTLTVDMAAHAGVNSFVVAATGNDVHIYDLEAKFVDGTRELLLADAPVPTGYAAQTDAVGKPGIATMTLRLTMRPNDSNAPADVRMLGARASASRNDIPKGLYDPFE